MAETPAATRTVERALALLGAVAAGGGTLSELARAVELSPSTASRLLGTLAQHEFVRRDGAAGRYRAGARLRQLAAATLREDPLYELAGPHLEALAAETGETANLAVAVDDGVLYLRQVASPMLVRTASWVGRTVPQRRTALGDVLAGRLGPDGYVARSGAAEPDVISIAAPVHGPGGEVAAALSVLAPSYRSSHRRVLLCGRAVAAHAGELSRSLGAGGAAAA